MKLWQKLLENWSKLVFKERHKEITPKIRAFRAFEEMTALLQAEDGTFDEALVILNQVFNKPKGERSQELGGVLVCLAGYAATAKLNLKKCFFTEYMRICDPVVMEKVRKRNLEGDKIGLEKKPIEDDWIDVSSYPPAPGIFAVLIQHEETYAVFLNYDKAHDLGGWFDINKERIEPSHWKPTSDDTASFTRMALNLRYPDVH